MFMKKHLIFILIFSCQYLFAKSLIIQCPNIKIPVGQIIELCTKRTCIERSPNFCTKFMCIEKLRFEKIDYLYCKVRKFNLILIKNKNKGIRT